MLTLTQSTDTDCGGTYLGKFLLELLERLNIEGGVGIFGEGFGT